MQSPQSKRSSLKSSNTSLPNSHPTTKIPDFNSNYNFIQNGANVYTSVVPVSLNFSDFIQLRGKEIDSFIRNNGASNISCLTTRFEQTGVKKIVVLAAIARSVYNYSTQTLEYYFNLTPNDEVNNQNFCQKTGLITKLSTLYSTLTPIYKLSGLCPTGICSQSSFPSTGLELFTSSGTEISQISASAISLKVSNTTASSVASGVTCTASTQCLSLGYDCCSLGQCVKDLALKSGINTSSSDYIQALQDILNNPSNIYLYPQYYYICSTPTNVPTPPGSTTDPLSAANIRLKKLEDLYKCTSKMVGEYGVCAITHKNALTADIDPTKTYSTHGDDRNFSGTFTNLDENLLNSLVSIEQVTFGEVVIYDYTTKTVDQLKQEPFIDANIIEIEGNHNDDLATGAKIRVLKKPASAVNTDLVIRYKIDASCNFINTSLAKCEKHYVQEQANAGDTNTTRRQGRVTDHYTDSANRNIFKLPTYADTTKTLTVEVDGVVQRRDIDWQLTINTSPAIEFLPISTQQVFKDQKVKISFFVNNSVYKVMNSKLKAQEEIKTMCSCADLTCTLKPIQNVEGKITDYGCVYPDPAPINPPLNQKIYLSSKTVPVRFFDLNGASHKTVTADLDPQEGTKFEYRSGNLLNPNNMPDITKTNDASDTYIGFNEIYGSLSYSNSSAKPAYEVNVKKGVTYDIYVDRGSLSNCVQCGNDYYSQLTKIFPLTQFGGGTIPLLGQTDRSMSSGIRSDEMKFGRACQVPATMLPWTHNPESQTNTQRKNRLSAQHFLFANGYQNDWYGFDYGAVIGSFDGVKWFAIGSNRRIKAETNKMFIAVNAPFGDLSLESTYEVTVNDGSLNPMGTNMVTSDFNSDGAQCQQFHVCSTDNDCATTLGWEYSCAPVSEITTSWPKFDDNAKEIPESSFDVNRLTSILNISSSTKRCVYRGKGALCTPQYASVTESTQTFNQSTNKAFHACSANQYCQPIAVNGILTNKFNNRIVRYGKIRTDSTQDSFGLGAPLQGRPLKYSGEESPTSETYKNLNANRALALCLPGRDVEQQSFVDQNRIEPTGNEFKGDKTLGMGMSYRKSTPTAADNYLMSCSIMDNTKNFYINNTTNASATFDNTAIYPNLKYDSGSQAISTNALAAFKSIFSAKNLTFNIFNNNSAILTNPSFTENRCMRAPGASCFTDLDCAPNKLIADKIKSLSGTDSIVTSILNRNEVLFWQEELICSQSTNKTSNLYDPKNNKCCRAVGKTISIPSGNSDNNINYAKVPGIDYNLNDPERYSRTATIYREINADPNTYPNLSVAVSDQCSLSTCQSNINLPHQYRTFSTLAEKTSCTGDWIRNFSVGGHKWESGRHQSMPVSIFRCLNWLPGSGSYSCEGYEPDDPACPLAQTPPTSSKAKAVFDYLGKLELMGIPQITLESETFFSSPTTEEGLSCRAHPNGRNNAYPTHPTLTSGTFLPPAGLFASTVSPKEYNDVVNTPSKGQMYSAGDNSNFSSAVKKIFKSDEISTCYQAGTQMKTGDDPSLCCTGMINSANLKCQLPDYVNLSVYTNRYVSSEAKKLSSGFFDENGYIKDPDYVANLACEKQMCASNTIGFGVLVSLLKTPGQTDSDNKYYRFIEGASADDLNSLLEVYNRGLRINNHAYCIPKALADSVGTTNDIRFLRCGN